MPIFLLSVSAGVLFDGACFPVSILKINKTNVLDIWIDSSKTFDTTNYELLLVKVSVKKPWISYIIMGRTEKEKFKSMINSWINSPIFLNKL